MFRRNLILLGQVVSQTGMAESFWVGQGGEDMAENAKLGAKSHQKEGDAENRPDVEEGNYIALHALKLRLNAEIRDLYLH